jgi:arylsulfatase
MKVDGEKVAEGRIERTIPFRFSLDEGLDVGEDTGTPVNLTCDVPFRSTGHLDKVTIDLDQVAKADQEAVEAADKLARVRKCTRD